MTNLKMLCEGLKEIARNHNFNVSVDKESIKEGCVCIWGGCNVPTLCDVELLCEDVGISKNCVDPSDCGISVYIDDPEWDCMAEYKKGLEFWRRLV